MFNTNVHMQRHRVGARGIATIFPLPWEALLSELQKLDEESSRGEAPDVPKVGGELLYIVHVLLKTSDGDDRETLARFVHQARVRRRLVVQRILDAKAWGHRA